MLNFRAIALLVLTFSYTTANAQVTGTVRSESGRALAHISVTLANDQSEDSQTRKTDAYGRYKFTAVTSGTYQLAFKDENFINYVDADPYPDEGTLYLNATYPGAINLQETQSLDLDDVVLQRAQATDNRQSTATVTDCTRYGDGQTPQTLSYALATARQIVIECTGAIPVPELTIINDVKITAPSGAALAASSYNRIFRVLPGVNLEVIGLNITNGDFTDGIALQNMGTTTIENAEITGHKGNSATLLNHGTLNLRNIRQYRNIINYDSVLTNTGVLSGSDVSIESHVASAGAVITNQGRIELRQCEITGLGTNNVLSITNNADSIIKLFDCKVTQSGSLFSNRGTLEIYDSAIEDNSGDQGLIESSGVLKIGGTGITNNEVYGAIVSNEGAAEIINSTISTNRASVGVSNEDYAGAISNQGLMTVTTSTIANNTHRGAGDRQIGNAGELKLTNTIIKGVTGGKECGGIAPVQSLGHNLHTDGTCGNFQQTDIPFGNPGLVALAANGGVGKTHTLQDGSDAIDTGNCANGALTKDQRGTPRPQGNGCDIGAYELVATDSSTDDTGNSPREDAGTDNDTGSTPPVDPGTGNDTDNTPTTEANTDSDTPTGSDQNTDNSNSDDDQTSTESGDSNSNSNSGTGSDVTTANDSTESSGGGTVDVSLLMLLFLIVALTISVQNSARRQ